jgi:hypothetical protein
MRKDKERRVAVGFGRAVRQEGQQMKVQFLLLGVLFCLAADAASKPSQSIPTAKKAGPVAQQI